MIRARVRFESPNGHIKVWKALAAPETYGEFLAMLFRSGYIMSRRHEQTDSWYPVFEKKVSATHSPEFQKLIQKQKIWKSKIHPTHLNGKPYNQ